MTNDSRVVPMELLKDMFEICDRTCHGESMKPKLRAIIDAPGVTPVGEFIRFGVDNYPSLQWHKDYVAKFGDKLYLAPPSEPAVPDEFCEWKPMDDEFMPGTYEGSCGAAWTFTDGGPKENTLNFCPECGRKVAAPKPDKENGS